MSNKNIKSPNRPYTVLFFREGIKESKKPDLLTARFSTTLPLALMIAVIPVLATRITGNPYYIALIRSCAKCCCGPIDFPNHASFVICKMKSAFLT